MAILGTIFIAAVKLPSLYGLIPFSFGFLMMGCGWWKIGKSDCRLHHVFMWIGGLLLMGYGSVELVAQNLFWIAH